MKSVFQTAECHAGGKEFHNFDTDITYGKHDNKMKGCAVGLKIK